MEACSECLSGRYIFDGTFGYVCNRRYYNLGGVKCNNRKMTPERFECVISDKIKDIYPILHEHRDPMMRKLYTLKPPVNTLVTANVEGPHIAAPTKVATRKQILKCIFIYLFSIFRPRFLL